MSDWNARVIEEFRANGGHVERFGDGLVLMHTVGAKSGEERVNPVAGIRQPDGGWIVAATWAGNDKNPPWFHNLVAHPDIDIEVSDEDGVRTVPVHATVLGEPERTGAWKQFTTRLEGFRAYEAKTTRVFPIVKFTRR